MKKVSMIIIFFTVIFGALGISKNAKALSVKNVSETSWAKISVGAWGSDASYVPYGIEPTATETWDRSDERGDLLVDHNNNKTYYVSSGFEGYLLENGDMWSGMWSNGDDFVKPIDTNVPCGTAGKIVVQNEQDTPVTVSISKWSSSDDGDDFTIHGHTIETWGRDDSRGYILHIKETNASYYIKSGVEILIEPGNIPTLLSKAIPQIYQHK